MPSLSIGAAVVLRDMNYLGGWLCDTDRPIEIQDFTGADVIAGDVSGLIAEWQKALVDHRGPRGIHGPFFGLDLSNPDKEIRAIIQKRLISGIEICAQLGADMMVIHSPFNYWHALNYSNYDYLRAALMDACVACLTPVLARAQSEGVTLVLENLDDTSPDDRMDLVRRLDHPRMKLSIDTGHADLAHVNYGAPPVTDFFVHAGAMLGHVHLQDVDGSADRHWHPGDGRIAWRPLMTHLAAQVDPVRTILEVRQNLHRLPATAAFLEGLLPAEYTAPASEGPEP